MGDVQATAAPGNAPDMLYVDELTGVRNRRFFITKFPELASRATQYKLPLTLCGVDVDYFKTINDTFGHHAGDQLLVELSQVMRQVLPRGSVPIRYGGDEFIVVFPDTTRADAVGHMRRLAEVVKKNHFSMSTPQNPLAVTLSVGVANFPQDASDPGKLYDLADKAGYISKKLGRDRVSTLDDAPDEGAV
ncbi:MAG: GGDEF domain-containing protein, partial [Candidatus Xenobia bacterium]